MSYRERGRKVVRKTRKKTATKLYESAYTNASVTSFGTCSSTRNWSSKSTRFLPSFRHSHARDLKVIISSGFTSGNNRLSGQKKRVIAVSSEPVSTQFLQPITIRIEDYSYLYIQYGISITLDHTIAFSWLSFSFDLSPFSWLVSPANRRTRMCLFFVRSASEDDLRNLHHAVCTLLPRLRPNHLLWSPPRYSVLIVFVYMPAD